VGLVDRIFTRIGAQDDIATGQSTFMVEMLETANILNHATSRSLVVLDEIGRGTSTYDGLAIARAIVEHLHDSPRLGATTVFATHYHELTELGETLDRVRCYRMDVLEEGDQVVFLRRVVPGGADRSYGIHVAEWPGIPRTVVLRARHCWPPSRRSGPRQSSRGSGQVQLTLFNRPPGRRAAALLDVDRLSPLRGAQHAERPEAPGWRAVVAA
jgi:DNA mismatch repair protein MutS